MDFVYTITIITGEMLMASITKLTTIFVIRFQRQILKTLAQTLMQHVIVTPYSALLLKTSLSPHSHFSTCAWSRSHQSKRLGCILRLSEVSPSL